MLVLLVKIHNIRKSKMSVLLHWLPLLRRSYSLLLLPIKPLDSKSLANFSKRRLEADLVPRSQSVTGNVRSGKVRFRACSVPARPEIRAFLSRGMFVLSVVILSDLAE